MTPRYSVDATKSAWRVVDGDVVIINAETTYYYSLNESGTRVWKLLLEHELSIEEIARALATAYDVDVGQGAEDAARLLERLHEEGLVAVRSDDDAAPRAHVDGSAREAGSYAPPELLKYDTLEELVVSGE
jgi:hypothetical protein